MIHDSVSYEELTSGLVDGILFVRDSFKNRVYFNHKGVLWYCCIKSEGEGKVPYSMWNQSSRKRDVLESTYTMIHDEVLKDELMKVRMGGMG